MNAARDSIKPDITLFMNVETLINEELVAIKGEGKNTLYYLKQVQIKNVEKCFKSQHFYLIFLHYYKVIARNNFWTFVISTRNCFFRKF